MPIPGISQPEILPVTEALRLRKFDGIYDFALSWYQDPELVWTLDGERAEGAETIHIENLHRAIRLVQHREEL